MHAFFPESLQEPASVSSGVLGVSGSGPRVLHFSHGHMDSAGGVPSHYP